MEEKKPKKSFGSKVASFFESIGNGVMKFFSRPGWFVRFIRKFRKILLAIPVVILACIVAAKSDAALPEYVGIIPLETGEYAYTVSHQVAVLGPLAVTAFCLLMMFCSRKTFYPWLISLFTLIIPAALLFTNSFIV